MAKVESEYEAGARRQVRIPQRLHAGLEQGVEHGARALALRKPAKGSSVTSATSRRLMDSEVHKRVNHAEAFTQGQQLQVKSMSP